MELDLDYRLKEQHGITNTLEIYARDTVHRRTLDQPRKQSARGDRAKSKPYSKRSVRAFVFFFRNIFPLDFQMTLTYPAVFPVQAAVIRAHLDRVIRWLKRRGISYVWILEFQARGAAHFHFFLSSMPDREAILKFWHKVSGAAQIDDVEPSEQAVYLAPINTWDGTTIYQTSPKEWYQRRVPDCIEGDLGNWYGHSRDIVAKPLIVVPDKPADGGVSAVQAGRVARHLNERLHEYPVPKDKGLFRHTTRDTGPAMLKYVTRSTKSSSQPSAREPKPHGEDEEASESSPTASRGEPMTKLRDQRRQPHQPVRSIRHEVERLSGGPLWSWPFGLAKPFSAAEMLLAKPARAP